MKATVTPVTDDIVRLSLEGHMDIPGTAEIDMKLTTLSAGDRQFVVVDLSQVVFMASIGIGAIVRCAKTIRLRSGNIVLWNPQPAVREVLERTMIHTIVPIYSDFGEACRAVKEAPPALTKHA
jgi:anti-sigma B factor antagonist